MPRLTAGDYLVFFRADWDVLNPVKKLVMNIYAPDPIEIKRVHHKRFSFAIFSMLDEWLSQRLRLGSRYEVPVMSGLED